MAKPYQEGELWSFRLRIKRQDIYRTGFASESLATKALDALRHSLEAEGKPAHGGPWRTTLAQALQTYAVERLPMLKGAEKDAHRINRYLRAAGLDVIRLQRPDNPVAGEARQGPVYWIVSLVPAPAKRKIPQGLSGHRNAQATRTRDSDKQRRTLAQTSVAEIEPYQIQTLIDAMCHEGSRAATVGLERALLRRLFNYARRSWNWPQPTRNPATHLTLPKIDNARDKILTNGEWKKICVALKDCLNPWVAPALSLLLQTAMRSSEALLRATWADFDVDRCILHLRDAKAGARNVPLNPAGMEVIQQLAQRAGSMDPAAQILPTTYEALKAAWNRACARAGVEGVLLHDLRHTSATRFSLELNGNMPVLKVITGHKTDSQLLRYINISADDVVRLLHGRPLSEDSAPAGYVVPATPPDTLPPAIATDPREPLPANVLRFERRLA